MHNAVIVTHNPSQKPIDKAVIWLHGLGASGHDFEPIVPELGLSADLAVKFVFPHAPSIPVTINAGHVMPAWYDILEMSLDRRIDETQILQSAARVQAIIEALGKEGIDSADVVVAGFSQGGAVAYQAALASARPLAGAMLLSTYFATQDSIEVLACRDMPILVMHGLYDDIVPAVLGERAVERLGALSFTPTFKTYGMAHQVCQAQIADIGLWLNAVFGQGVA